MNISYYSLSPCLFLLLPTSSPSLPLPTLPPFLATFPRHLSSPPHLATPSRHTISPHHLATPSHHTISPHHLTTPSHHATSPRHLAQPPHHPSLLSFLPHISHFPGTRLAFLFPSGLCPLFLGSFLPRRDQKCLFHSHLPLCLHFWLENALFDPVLSSTYCGRSAKRCQTFRSRMALHIPGTAFVCGRSRPFRQTFRNKSQTFRAKSSCRFSPDALEQKRRLCSREG